MWYLRTEDMTSLEWSLRPLGVESFGKLFAARHAFDDVFAAAVSFPGYPVSFVACREGKWITTTYATRAEAIEAAKAS